MFGATHVAGAKPTRGDRQAALKLGGEALDLYAAADYLAALEKFSKADAIVPAPTLKLHIARCLDKLDRLLEAAEKYREVIATELKADSPAVYRAARKKAVPELATVLDETPTVRVTVKGRDAAKAALKMDGEPVDIARVGEKMSLDPGHYRFDAIVDERSATREIDLDRSQHERVVLYMPAGPEPNDAPNPGGEDDGALAWQIAGWASLVVGAAGLTLGTVTGVMVLSQEGDLLMRCPNRQCPTSVHEDAKSFDTKRIASTVGFVVGGVGVAAGVSLLLLAPGGVWGGSEDGDDTEESTFRPLVGPGFIGVEGTF